MIALDAPPQSSGTPAWVWTIVALSIPAITGLFAWLASRTAARKRPDPDKAQAQINYNNVLIRMTSLETDITTLKNEAKHKDTIIDWQDHIIDGLETYILDYKEWEVGGRLDPPGPPQRYQKPTRPS